MTEFKPAVELEPEPLSDQLHQRACIVCARSDGELLSDGHVQTVFADGDPLVWAAVACPEHQGRRSC